MFGIYIAINSIWYYQIHPLVDKSNMHAVETCVTYIVSIVDSSLIKRGRLFSEISTLDSGQMHNASKYHANACNCVF